MESNKVRGGGSSPAFIALTCVGFITSAPALAQGAPAEEGAELQGVTVTDTAIEDGAVKVDRAESPKYLRPLLDTPQTITVISNQTLQKQNLLTLRDALSTIPGITFGAGEGGGGYGDSINLRGQSANTDLQIDGVRDSAQYNRTDTFNIEQIEVVNGANSVFGGSGSISGSINLVTKRPKDQDLTVVQGAIGTADYYRGTIDTNLKVADNIAFRLNAMGHRNDVPGRDFEYFKRWGIAPAVTIGIGTPTSLTFLYTHQEDKNIPAYGVPYYKNALYDGLLPGTRYSGYYGYRNIDKQDQTFDQATAIFAHDFSDKVSIRNLSRWQRVQADVYVDPPQGTFCLDNGQTPTGAACPAGQNVPGTFYPSGPRGTTRLTDTQILYSQTDLRAVLDTGGIEQTLTLGVSVGQEDYKIRNGNVLRNAGAATPNPVLNPIDLSDPNPVYTGPVNFIQSNYGQGDTLNKAVYLFDAIKFSEQFEINGGVRYENTRTNFRTDTLSTVPATLGAYTRGPLQHQDDDLFSYRIAAVFKPAANASLYAAYGNSRTPVSAGVRSGCGTISPTAPNIDPCDAKPQEALNYELGGKVDLVDGRLQLTASLFRNERTNYPVTSNDPAFPTLQVRDGRSRVDGVTLGASGNISDAWTIFANYTYLKSKVLQSISDFQKDNGVADPQAGNRLTNTPRHSGSLFTTYTLPFGLQLGYGLTYQGSFLLNNAAGIHYKSDDYLVHRALLSYPIGAGLTAQVNVQNVTDEKYFTGIRNNGWAVPGEGRSAVFSLFYSF